MSDSSSSQDEHEEILARFMADLEKRGKAIIDEYLGRYPHLQDRISQLLKMQKALEASRLKADSSLPQIKGFQMIRLVAIGGMGEVYEAIQERLKRRVAIKIIRQGRFSAEAKARFLREQEVLARLHQTHIVPIHTADEVGDMQFFAMPFIDGATLHHLVRSTLQLNPSNNGHRTPSLGQLAQLVVTTTKAGHDTSSAVHHREGCAPPTEKIDLPDWKANHMKALPGHKPRLTLSADYFR